MANERGLKWVEEKLKIIWIFQKTENDTRDVSDSFFLPSHFIIIPNTFNNILLPLNY